MIKAFKFRAQAISSLLEKTHPPGSQNLSSRIFFIIYIIPSLNKVHYYYYCYYMAERPKPALRDFPSINFNYNEAE